MEQRYKTEMRRVLDTYLDARPNARTFENRAVILFGHCNATEVMADYLLSKGITPIAILDNSTAKQGLEYQDIPIEPPTRIKDFSKDNSITLIATRFYAEMSAQLRQLGYDGEIIQVVEYDSFSEFSLTSDTINRRKSRMLRGYETLERIRALYPSYHFVVCPYNALGDVYWAMAFLPAYCEKYGINETAIIVASDSSRQIAELFGAEPIITLDYSEMDELVQAIVFTREDNCVIAHHNRPYTDLIIRYLDKHFLSFIDYYRYAIYGLAKDAPASEPSNFAAFENLAKIPKGKSVILSPYAKSVAQLPETFWKSIAEEYVSKGYHAYTGAVGDEIPICGTEKLNIPLAQMKSAAEYAGAFVGIRSGLCDVLYTANCRKTVVFPNCYYSSTPHKVEDFFALPNWEKIVI